MRLVMDMLIALLLTSMLIGAMWEHRANHIEQQHRDLTRNEVRRFQQQIALQAALAQVENNERGYPATIDPAWFQGSLPANPLLDASHPWVEIADPSQRDLVHPLDRVATSRSQAKFWYNPANGCVRARVPGGLSDSTSLFIYNYVNDCNLPDLFAQ